MKKKGILVTSFTLIGLLLIGFFGYQYYQNNFSANIKTTEDYEQVDEESKPKQEEKLADVETISTVTLAAVGDILVHDTVYNSAYVGDGKYNFNPMFELVKPYLTKADITMANQETMIGGTEIGVSSYPSFNSPYEVGDALKANGVDLVTIANNHTLDRGEKAILNALNHWDDIGLQYTGSYRDVEDSIEIRTITKNGITLSFLSYTYGTNGIPVPDGKDYLVNMIELEKIKADIKEAEGISDVVVVSLHFGNEYQRLPSEQQTTLAKEVANAGADIIIGHHPHVLQPVDWIERDNGEKTFIVYSLGNFISGQRWDYKDIGGILQLTVEKVTKGEDVQISVKNPAFMPTFVIYQNFKITPLEQLPDQKAVYEEIKQHMNQWVPELKFTF
jgi:poly-gamma-glutamate capsule biosynthesis protein CapA/YwtB (metallophosphatase superfamily)